MTIENPLFPSEENPLFPLADKIISLDEIYSDNLKSIADNVIAEVKPKFNLEDIKEVFLNKETLINKVLELKFFSLSKETTKDEFNTHFRPNPNTFSKLTEDDEEGIFLANKEMYIVNKFNTVHRYGLQKEGFYRDRYKKIVTDENTPCDEMNMIDIKSVHGATKMSEEEFDLFLAVEKELFL